MGQMYQNPLPEKGWQFIPISAEPQTKNPKIARSNVFI